jgi:hypothetical protein
VLAFGPGKGRMNLLPDLNEALFLVFFVVLPLGLLWPAGAILFSKKASWRGKCVWISVWLLVLLASLAIDHFHYQYLLASGYPRKLVSRDAVNGVAMAMVLGWGIYLLFRYRTGDFPQASAAVQRIRHRVKSIFRD